MDCNLGMVSRRKKTVGKGLHILEMNKISLSCLNRGSNAKGAKMVRLSSNWTGYSDELRSLPLNSSAHTNPVFLDTNGDIKTMLVNSPAHIRNNFLNATDIKAEITRKLLVLSESSSRTITKLGGRHLAISEPLPV